MTPASVRLQGNQILSGLSLDEYKSTLRMIERAILATDLALYMKWVPTRQLQPPLWLEGR